MDGRGEFGLLCCHAVFVERDGCLLGNDLLALVLGAEPQWHVENAWHDDLCCHWSLRLPIPLGQNSESLALRRNDKVGCVCFRIAQHIVLRTFQAPRILAELTSSARLRHTRICVFVSA